MHTFLYTILKNSFIVFTMSYYTCAKEMMLMLKLLHDHTITNCIRKVFTFKTIKTCIQDSTSIYMRTGSET